MKIVSHVLILLIVLPWSSCRRSPSEPADNSTLSESAWERVDQMSKNWIASIAATPGGQLFVVASEGLYRSTDLGNQWTRVYYGDLGGVAIEPSTGVILIGIWNFSDGWANISRDNGNTWEPPTGIPGRAVASCVFSSPSRCLLGLFYGEASDGGLAVSNDTGKTWALSSLPHQYRVTSILPLSPDTIVIGTQNGFTFAFEFFRSTDGGTTWSVASSPGLNYSIDALSLGPDTQLLAGTRGNGLYVSTDKGQSWFQSAFPGQYISAIFTELPHFLFLASQSWKDARATNYILTSINAGASWSAMKDTVFSSQILSLAIDSRGRLYAGTFANGLYRTRQPIKTVISRGQD